MDVIKEVMTRGTAHPDAGEPEGADTEPEAPWVVDETEARSIFDAFKREVSLVEPEGDSLRHRPDLRSQMLPLIRAARPKRFEALNRLAFNYFRTRAEKDSNDLASAAEAIYHGLWLEEPLSLLNRLWPASPSFDPKIDLEEFKRHSPASIFVRAKTSAALAPDEVSKLPREVALDWLDARGARLLNNRHVEDSIHAIREAAGSDYEALEGRPATAAVLARLMYRAGLWDDAARLARRYLDSLTYEELAGLDERKESDKSDPRPAALLSLFRTWMTIAAKCDSDHAAVMRLAWEARARDVRPHIDPAAQAAEPTRLVREARLRDPFTRLDIAAHAILAIQLSTRNTEAGTADWLKSMVEHPPINITRLRGDIKWDWLKREPRILRLMILVSGWRPDLMAAWVESRERVPRDVEQSVLIELFLRIFRDTPGESTARQIVNDLDSPRRAEALNALDELWRREKRTVLEALREHERLAPMFRQLVACEHSDWVRPLGNALARAFKQDEGGALAALLDEANFQTGKGALSRRRDGLAVVQTAADEGRLLALASSLGHWEKTFLGKGGGGETQPAEHPQDVFGLSSALLLWHQKIVESARSTEPSPFAV